MYLSIGFVTEARLQLVKTSMTFLPQNNLKTRTSTMTNYYSGQLYCFQRTCISTGCIRIRLQCHHHLGGNISIGIKSVKDKGHSTKCKAITTTLHTASSTFNYNTLWNTSTFLLLRPRLCSTNWHFQVFCLGFRLLSFPNFLLLYGKQHNFIHLHKT